MTAEYNTTGKFFITPTMTGCRGLIGMSFADYQKLLALGIMDEEVELTATAAEYGNEYAQGVPTHHMKAGLYTIEINANEPKPQMDVAEQDVRTMLDKGFKDCGKVNLTIAKLPYSSHREANYDGLKLDIDI